MISFNCQKDFSVLQREMGRGVHLEIVKRVKGSILYCQKDTVRISGPYTKGNVPQYVGESFYLNKENSHMKIRKHNEENKWYEYKYNQFERLMRTKELMMRDIKVKYSKDYKMFKDLIQEDTERRNKNKYLGEQFMIYCYGTPGTGKSTFFRDFLESLDLKYCLYDINNKYNVKPDIETNNLLIDEYRPSNNNIRKINSLADDTRFPFEYKGGMIRLNVKISALISNFKLDELTPKVDELYRKTIFRRINIYMCVEKTEENLKVRIVSKDRGDYGKSRNIYDLVLNKSYIEYGNSILKTKLFNIIKENINDDFKKIIKEKSN